MKAKVDIKLHGDEELIKTLAALQGLDFARKAIKEHTSKLEKIVVKNTTPGVVFVKGYSEGDTKKSHNISIYNDGLTGEVGVSTHYAPYVELGTRKMEAEPFMRPSMNEVEPGFVEDLGKMGE